MRFLSKFGRYGIQYRPIRVEAYATGNTTVVQQPIYIIFREGTATIEERGLAIQRWSFEGSYQEQDEVTTVAPDYRIGVWDSELAQADNGWSDDERIDIENFLINYSYRLEDVMVVPLVMVPPPWPRYDEYSGAPAALVRKLVDEGHDLGQALSYEQSVQKRPEVIAAIESELADPVLAEREIEEEIVG